MSIIDNSLAPSPGHMPGVGRATPQDAPALTEIAHAAKRYWGYPESWIQRWRSELSLDGRYVTAHPVFTIRQDRAPIGFAAIIPYPDQAAPWELAHLWVLPDHTGRGWGRMLLTRAAAEARRLHAPAMRILSDPHAEGFYRRMGAATIGRVAASMDGTERWLPDMRLRLPDP